MVVEEERAAKAVLVGGHTGDDQQDRNEAMKCARLDGSWFVTPGGFCSTAGYGCGSSSGPRLPLGHARITRDSGSADTRLAGNDKRVPFPLVATAGPVLLHEIDVVAARRVRAKMIPLRAARHENPRQVAGRDVVVDLAVIAENQEARSVAGGRVPAERHAGGADLKAEH